MTRCPEFYERWEREPNWCEKSPKAVEQIDLYLKFVDELAEKGLEKERTFVLLPEGASRDFIRIPKGKERDWVISTLVEYLNSLPEGKQPSKRKLRGIYDGRDFKEIHMPSDSRPPPPSFQVYKLREKIKEDIQTIKHLQEEIKKSELEISHILKHHPEIPQIPEDQITTFIPKNRKWIDVLRESLIWDDSKLSDEQRAAIEKISKKEDDKWNAQNPSSFINVDVVDGNTPTPPPRVNIEEVEPSDEPKSKHAQIKEIMPKGSRRKIIKLKEDKPNHFIPVGGEEAPGA